MLKIQLIRKLYNPGKFGQWIAVMTVSLCALSCSSAYAWPSGALPKIRSGKAGFTLSLNEQSWITSVMFIGNIISPVPSSYMMQSVGRRNVLCIVVWLQVIAFLMISLTSNFWLICAARILCGYWMGLVFYVVPVYMGECVDPKIRGTAGTVYCVFLYAGSLLISLIGSFSSYAALCWFPVAFNILLALLLCLIPESPYYYLDKGDSLSARASLSWLRGSVDESVMDSIQQSIEENKKYKSTFLEIFKKPSTRKGFIIAALLGSIQRSSGLSILLPYTSVTFPDYIITAEEFTIVLNVVWGLSTFATTFIAERFGRRVLLGVSCLGSSLSMLGVSIWFFLKENTEIDVDYIMWLPFFLLILHGITYSVGLVSIPTMTPGEMFSPEIKSKASALVNVWIAITYGIVLNVYLPLEESVGKFSNYLICCISSFIGVLTAKFIMIETRGRSLEEIQHVLEGKPP